MTQFDDREKAFEKKFELDEEAQFRVLTRTAKLFGLWAAGQMGLQGAQAETYAAQMADIVIAKPDREGLVKKAEQDLTAKGITLSHHRLEKEMSDCEQLAHKDVA